MFSERSFYKPTAKLRYKEKKLLIFFVVQAEISNCFETSGSGIVVEESLFQNTRWWTGWIHPDMGADHLTQLSVLTGVAAVGRGGEGTAHL